MYYPVAIEWGDENTATGIVIPDIEGAITAGDSVEEALKMAIEVVCIKLEELRDAGEAIPFPSDINILKQRPEFSGWGWGIIEIDVAPYLGKTEKINVTLPGSVINQIDNYVSTHGLRSRSAFLANAALEKLRTRSQVKASS